MARKGGRSGGFKSGGSRGGRSSSFGGGSRSRSSSGGSFGGGSRARRSTGGSFGGANRSRSTSGGGFAGSRSRATRNTGSARRGHHHHGGHYRRGYRRRSGGLLGCLVVIGLLLIVLIIVLLVFVVNASGNTGSDDAAPAAATELAGADAEPDEQALANPVQCRTEALDVQLDLAASTGEAGVPVQVPVTITNTGDVPCLTDTGHEAMALEIHSGDDLIWSTGHCPGGTDERDLLLDVGATETHTVTWDGTRGTSSCDSGQSASAGTYRAEIALGADGGQAVAEATFTLN